LFHQGIPYLLVQFTVAC